MTRMWMLGALLAPTSALAVQPFGGYSAHALSDPGGHVGLELPLAEASGFGVFTSLALQGYVQPGDEVGGLLNLRYGTRYTRPLGPFVETGLGVAYEHYVYTETRYRFEDDVATATETRRQRPAFAPNVFLGLGFDLSQRMFVPVRVYVRPAMYWRIPDQNLALQGVTEAQLGLTWVR